MRGRSSGEARARARAGRAGGKDGGGGQGAGVRGQRGAGVPVRAVLQVQELGERRAGTGVGEAGSPAAGSAASPGAWRCYAGSPPPGERPGCGAASGASGSGPLTRRSSRRAVGGQHRPGGERGRQRQRGGGGSRLLPRASRAGGSASRCLSRLSPDEAAEVLDAPSLSPLPFSSSRPWPAAAVAAMREAAAGMGPISGKKPLLRG